MRWYHSLSLRLLLLFWVLLFAVASSGYLLALWFSKPIEPEPVPTAVQESLAPLLSEVATFRSLTPGRLLAGDYRVAASLAPSGKERLQLDRTLGMNYRGTLMRQLEAEQPQQLPLGNLMLLGPFQLEDYRILITRPITPDERQEQVLTERETQRVQTLALLVGSLAISILLGAWLVMPLRRLTQATREIAKGSEKPDLRRLPKRNDELGELARALATTAYDLAVSRDAQRRLLSDVSHELRSPLARMQVALMLSQEQDSPEQQANHIDQLGRDLERLSTIIERILSLSRLENGLVQLQTEQVDIRRLATQLIKDLRYVNASQGQRVQFQGDGVWPVSESDPELLRLVIENLVRNALQYSDDDVEISCQTTSNDYTIIIRDHGPGVPDDQLSQLFTPFYRADLSRNHKAGVGLGMALSLRAAAVLGGTISARNHPEGGLEVAVNLPLSEPGNGTDQNGKS
ncbi:HAMP domain-containing sensor histidine kinase [Pseudidiomarina terrestris]|uniref:HAMP domain-containing sensor histidine kinase n=1 Tax=Pseudidiomarina terrestris TaxID=2820060 RepID=UPI00264C4511|nr:HAMP domain-containing sensor histidine kinase [Pseudidiomarina sp. 1ASP75-5]MDN7136527.1 HAMP domain-containing histidine kinase [Pseudidiomarina sp. 1ASP75-5]